MKTRRWKRQEQPAVLRVFLIVVKGIYNCRLTNFIRFGLDGPTRYNDVGEKYLRLYGVLSATYLQQNSVLELYRLMNVPNLKKARKQLEALKIRGIRNKLASHSTNHKNQTTKKLEAFAPVQITLSGLSCQIASLTLDPPENIDFKKAFQEHNQLILDLLDTIYEKTFKTLYKGVASRLAEYTKKLEDIRVYKEGGQIIEIGNTKVVINAEESQL